MKSVSFLFLFLLAALLPAAALEAQLIEFQSQIAKHVFNPYRATARTATNGMPAGLRDIVPAEQNPADTGATALRKFMVQLPALSQDGGLGFSTMLVRWNMVSNTRHPLLLYLHGTVSTEIRDNAAATNELALQQLLDLKGGLFSLAFQYNLLSPPATGYSHFALPLAVSGKCILGRATADNSVNSYFCLQAQLGPAVEVPLYSYAEPATAIAGGTEPVRPSGATLHAALQLFLATNGFGSNSFYRDLFGDGDANMLTGWSFTLGIDLGVDYTLDVVACGPVARSLARFEKPFITFSFGLRN